MADLYDVTAMHRERTGLTSFIVLSLATLWLQTGVEAQTIDSQDTRTFQDNRVQDTRQNPTPVAPGEAERLKRLKEQAVAPDTREQSDSGTDTDVKNKEESDNRQSSPPARGN